MIAALLVALVIGVVQPVSQPGAAEPNVVTCVVSHDDGEDSAVFKQAYMPYYRYTPTFLMDKEVRAANRSYSPSCDYSIVAAYMPYY